MISLIFNHIGITSYDTSRIEQKISVIKNVMFKIKTLVLISPYNHVKDTTLLYLIELILNSFVIVFSETIRTNDRNLRKVTRDVERDRRELERDEKKLELEIKKAAKEGNKQACTVLAKQLIQLRKQKTRSYQVI